MIGLLIAMVLIAVPVFLGLRYHPTMRYPLRVVRYGNHVYYWRDKPWVWRYDKKEAVRRWQAQETREQKIYAMLREERIAQSILRPESLIRISGV